MGNNIELKSIKELCDKKEEYPFYIPSYQRGYRWTKLEVEKLLDDINEFDKNIDGDFYCLQPLVVKKGTEGNSKDKWRVIDGQQRLTTIYLILCFLLNDNNSELYSIDYERGDVIWNDIIGISKENNDDDNIETFYLKSNYKVINDWFINHNDNKISTNILENTKFIWYDIGSVSKEIEYLMFRNLNSGKIPLTNAELVKALFLKNTKGGDTEKELSQNIIAEEYDQIERKMREPEFWYFLAGNEPRRTSCIELLFDLMFETDGMDDSKRKEIEAVGKNKTFFYFDWCISYDKETNRLSADKQFEKAKEIWENVQEYFHTLEGWFADAEVYNLIGYLRAVNHQSLSDIYKLHKSLLCDDSGNPIQCENKQEFISQLKQFCKEACLVDDNGDVFDPIEDNLKNPQYFHYENRKWAVNRILLMHNIAALNLQNAQTDKDNQGESHSDKKARKDKMVTKSKFSFASYHLCKWHVEHISPNNAQKKQYDENFIKVILNNPGISLEDDDKFKEKLVKDDDKKKLDPYIAVRYKSIMTLPNLTLLTEHINTQIGNKSFEEKQGVVLKDIADGYFVPNCTLMVFTKGYTLSSQEKNDKLDPSIKHVFWNAEDRGAYIKNMSETLIGYLTEKGDKTNE